MGKAILYLICLGILVAGGLYGYSWMLEADQSPQVHELTIHVD